MMRAQLLLALFASGVGLLAQDTPKVVRADFRVFPVLNIEERGIFYRPAPDAEMIELQFRTRARSFDTYEYRGPETLRFFREDGLNEAGEMQYRVVGEVAVAAREMLIFFANAAAQAPLEFSLLALDDSPSGLPMNHVSFLNFTPVAFACRFMDRDMILEPGENGPISVEEKLGEDIFIGLAVTNQETRRIILKNRWQFHEGNRHYILLLPPQRQGSFRIRAFRISEFVGDNQRFNSGRTPPVLSSYH